MNILLTGASSFTGYWFARELAAAGHEVTALLRRPAAEYTDALRRQRAADLESRCRIAAGIIFGDDKFLALVRDGGFDVLCHHAADVTNYKSPDFDVVAAVENNTRQIAQVTSALKSGGCRRLVVTGSVFENDEGAGSGDLAAFSPYGLSKALTWQMFRYYSERAGMAVGKFVIANPFGPQEEPRFTSYLMKNWLAGETPAVNTPDYVRDNIHVSLLAKAYCQFVSGMPSSGACRLAPSGYVESQGAFAQRLASEMRSRIGRPCHLELRRQTDFSEPLIRINTDPVAAEGFDPSTAWDDMASYYQRLLAAK
jgi:nucleoside-diphosphate-sugar epimerase